MEKNVKWTAKELFDTFASDTNVDEFKELYKALLAREIGLDEYTEAADELMDEVLEDGYYRTDSIESFIDNDIVIYAHEAFDKANFDIDNWF